MLAFLLGRPTVASASAGDGLLRPGAPSGFEPAGLVAKATPSLIDEVRLGKSVGVALWLHYDGDTMREHAEARLGPLAPELGESPAFDEREIEAVLQEIRSFNAQVVANAVKPVVAALQDAGIEVVYASRSMPVVMVEASPAAIEELSQWKVVDTLYLESDSEDLNQHALEVHRTDDVWLPTGMGAGRRVAVFERKPLSGRWLDVAATHDPGASTAENDHANAVAGSIASRMTGRIGSAFLVKLLSANSGSYRTRDVIETLDWLVEQVPSVTNMSWGFDTEGEFRLEDRLFDFQVFYNLHPFVAAAGNTGTAGGFVHSPATAWNVISVGNFDSKDTAWWEDDTIYPTSSFRNPRSETEKPNVVARGTRVVTLASAAAGYRAGPDHVSASSFAAPFVTATVALAMNVHPALLASPEAAMASVMASAWNDVQGHGPLSDKDGAGGICTRAMVHMARDLRLTYRYVGGPGSARYPPEREFWLQQRQPTRAVIAWSADPGRSSYLPPRLDSDFDLVVRYGWDGGEVLGVSRSRTNNFEIVEFTPPETGYYTLAIEPIRAERSVRVGIAVSQQFQDEGY